MSDSAIPWTVACQAPLSMEFSRQEYWSGLLCHSPGDLHYPGVKPRSPAIQEDFFLSFELLGKPVKKKKERERERLRSAGAAGGREEIPHVQGQEQRLHFSGAAMKRYPMSKIRETPVRL